MPRKTLNVAFMYRILKYIGNKFKVQSSNRELTENINNSLTEFQKCYDKEENDDTTIPTDEHIKVRVIWVVEAYTPEYVNQLLDAVKKFGWNNPNNLSLSEDVYSWIIRARGQPYQSWRNLGYIAKEGKSRFTPYRPAPLPNGVTGAHGYLIQLIPSTTLLVMQFILDEERELSLENPLRKQYSTFIRHMEKRYLFVSPTQQKRESIKNKRQELYKMCCDWFISHAPGVFSNSILEGDFPIWEFITLDKGMPFVDKKEEKCNDPEKSKRRINFNYIDLLNLRMFSRVWENDDFVGIKLSELYEENSSFSRLIIAGKTSEIFSNEDLKSYGGRNTNGFASRLTFLSGTIGIWSLGVLLKAYILRLSEVRDSVIDIEEKNIHKTTEKLKQVQNKFVKLEKDIPSFAFEIERLCRDEKIYFHNTYDFKSINPWMKDIKFLEIIHDKLIKGSSQIKDEQNNVRQSINTTAQVVASISNEIVAKTNVSIQHRIMWMTGFLLVLTIISIPWERLFSLINMVIIWLIHFVENFLTNVIN